MSQILSQERLIRRGQALGAGLYDLRADPRARPRPVKARPAACDHVRRAVMDREGRIRGALYGGVLLNRNHEIVDLIKNNVYRDEQYNGKEVGTRPFSSGTFAYPPM